MTQELTRRLHRPQAAAPGSPTVCEDLDVEQSRLRVLVPTFFANGAEGGGVRERALGPPTHVTHPLPPGPGTPRRLLAAQGGRAAGRGSSAPPLELMAGCRITPVLVFWTLRVSYWVKFTFETGFELSSSWTALPCYGLYRNRNILDFMRWPQIDLVAQDLNDIQRPKSFQNSSWK
jgi:hypothetical protein